MGYLAPDTSDALDTPGLHHIKHLKSTAESDSDANAKSTPCLTLGIPIPLSTSSPRNVTA
ncbi:hypothetical protein N7463_006458 [Penicillium fimorum]|uniref:Uncharacterized protein n=1 Tax=Penicillium fimorum TaxID=1882269 RepID=A0A9X0C631_9EURO|nr:hypothetical protein N7463_006458 [Penicillium fimorum]